MGLKPDEEKGEKVDWGDEDYGAIDISGSTEFQGEAGVEDHLAEFKCMLLSITEDTEWKDSLDSLFIYVGTLARRDCGTFNATEGSFVRTRVVNANICTILQSLFVLSKMLIDATTKDGKEVPDTLVAAHVVYGRLIGEIIDNIKRDQNDPKRN